MLPAAPHSIATRVPCASVRQFASRPSRSGADGETRTHTANATAPSRQRVYQFHHVGFCHFGISLGFESVSLGGAAGIAGPEPCGTSDALVSLAAGAGAVSVTPCFIMSVGPLRVAPKYVSPRLD